MMNESSEQARLNAEQAKLQAEKLKDELTAQADKFSDQVRLQTEKLRKEVTKQVITQLREDFQKIRTEIAELKNKFQGLAETVQKLENFAKLQSEQNSLKTNVGQVASQSEALANKCEGKGYKFMEHKDKKINQKLETELQTAVQQTVTSVYVKQNTSLQAQTELNKISTLNRELPVWKNNVTSQGNNTQREISAVTYLPTNSQRVTNQVEKTYSRPESSSSVTESDIEPRALPSNCVSCGVGVDRTTSSVHHEESFLRIMKFRVFNSEKENLHPVVSIKSFRDVWPRSWTEKQKIHFATGFIQGEATLWATEVTESCSTFEEFEKAFLNKYWSYGIQERLRNQVFNPKPYNFRKGSLRKYFEHYLNKTYFWDEPISHQDVLLILQGKLPICIREKLVRVSVNNLERFMKTLDDIDLWYEDISASNNDQNDDGTSQTVMPCQQSINDGTPSEMRAGFVPSNGNRRRKHDNPYHLGYQNNGGGHW